MSEVIKLNGRDFNFDCVFFNATSDDKNFAMLPISYGAFEFLEITDNIFSPFLECSFGIDNPLNFIENTPGDKPFRFSANNRNLCNIQLTPVDTANSEDDDIRKKNSLGIFGVIDEGSIISSENSETSISTYDLIDTKLASLLEVKVGYVYPKIATDKTVSENIRDLILKVHGEDVSVIDKDFNLGKAGGVTITTNYPFPLSYNLYDAINFLLKFNIATVNNIESQLFLKYNYGYNTYSNYSLYDLFNKAETQEVNQETFIIGGKEGPQDTANIGESSSTPLNNFTNNKTLKENIIHNVNFSNVNFNISNQDLVPIYYTTTSNPTNISNLGMVDMSKAMELFETNVLNTPSMKKIYGSSQIKLNVHLDESKLGQQNYKVISTNFNADVNEKVAKAQLYNSFMLQNMSLSFKVKGQPFRQAGSFIILARATDKTKGKEFDKKLLGQWLVTQVTHRINRTEYETYIQCIKPFTVA